MTDPTTNPYAPPKTRVEDAAAADPAPALWNPNAAALWSLVFSPIFGAWLHMKNWQALGEPAKAAESKMWIYLLAGFFVLLVALAALMPESKVFDMLTQVSGFGLLIGWYVASGRHQVRHIKLAFGPGYPRKGWGKPLLTAFLCLLGFVVAAGVVGFIAAMVTGAGSTA